MGTTPKRIEFEVLGPPVGYTIQLGRFANNKKKFKYVAYKKLVQEYAAHFMALPLQARHAGEPIKITTHAYFVNGVHPDPENVHKGVKDALFYGGGGCGDKYTGGSYSPPLYDPENPRVTVIVEFP